MNLDTHGKPLMVKQQSQDNNESAEEKEEEALILLKLDKKLITKRGKLYKGIPSK